MDTAPQKPNLDELFNEDTPEGYYETLRVMFEAYIGSEQCDGSNGQQRLRILSNYKAIRRFLYRASRERRSKALKPPPHWIS
jgi:hypothetical protein